MYHTRTACTTVVDLLRWRAAEQPERCAYTFLAEDQEIQITYEELDKRARVLAARLQQVGATGERALLLYPPGLDYIVAFYGCLYAGVLAVPAYPPRMNGNLGRLQAVITDAQATFALTTEQIQRAIERRFVDTEGIADLNWLATDGMAFEETLADTWQLPAIDGQTLAFLQYTSGSTSTPKGVMLTHGNLLHNLELIGASFGTSADSRGVVWLPPYHDMGLIGGILQPLFGGYPMTLMAPVDFIQSPLRWLQAISKTQATVSGGPNFAFDLCVQKITPEQRDTLDLSSWSNAFTGAEPIRDETLERFAEFFAPCGFRREAFYPCYGLAESTLFVAGGSQDEAPIVRHFQSDALEQNQVVETQETEEGTAIRTLVSSGRPSISGQRIEIVHPESGLLCAEEQVGEIWVAGSSVAQGYWNRFEQTQQTFHAQLTETGDGPFLRTGDLGFVANGELFVTGRLKDLIIIRGRNYYPQDIEFAVQESHPALPSGFGAAVAVEIDGEERLVIVQEIDRKFRKANLEEAIRAARQAIAEQFQLQAYAVVLIKPASIPKTSSGKIQRHACRDRFVAGTLDVVASDVIGRATAGEQLDAAEAGTAIEQLPTISRDILLTLPEEERQGVLETWLLHQAADVLKMSPAHVTTEQPLSMAGLDSIMAVELKNRMEETIGAHVPMVTFLEGPSVAQLAHEALHLMHQVESQEQSEVLELPSNGVVPLSYGQRALWFLQRMAPESTAYNISHAVRIEGALDVDALRETFKNIVQRHAALRTLFNVEKGEPVQLVQETGELAFDVHGAQTATETELQALVNDAAHRPFDLEKGPLLRVHLFVRSEREHVLLLTMHHIITDFWSQGVLIRELRELYGAMKQGTELTLAELPMSFAHHVLQQQQMLAGARGEQMWAYWQKQLAGALPVLNLPTDRPRPPVQSYRGAAHSFQVSAEVVQQLKELGKSHGATLYMTLLAAYQVLLHRYTGQEDVLVGSPTTGRTAAKQADVIGYFVNPVVLRADLSAQMSFRAFLQQVRQTVLGALDHQDFPFPLLVERLQPQRDPSYPPLIQTMFVLQKSHVLDEEGLTALALQESAATLAGELPMSAYPLQQRAAQFDLTLTVAEHEGALTAAFEYCSDLFDEKTVARMAGHFQTLLAGVVQNPEQWVTHLPLLTPVEEELLLRKWNTIALPQEADQPLHRRFEKQAQRTPERVAVVYEQAHMTYAELNRRANRLAHYLLTEGVSPGVMVGLSVERSLEMVVGILAILKAGGAYVPIDPSTPEDRISFIADDAKVAVLLTQQQVRDQLPTAGVNVICIEEVLAGNGPEENLDVEVRPDDLAYVIYTSGSTGKPKGVLINHSNVIDLFCATDAWYGFNETDVWSMFHSYAFDFSVWELWGALLYGGRLVVVPYGVSRSPELFYKLLCDEGVTVLNQTPSAFRQLIQAEEQVGMSPQLALRYVIFGGEALELQSLQPWYERHADHSPQLVNMYGITETTVHVTYRPITVEDVRSGAGSVIGWAMPGWQVYVLDRHLQPVPIGVVGEIYVGGVGLARGYHNRPELTAERFLPHLFSEEPAARLYKSGDLARVLPDGTLQYQGRIDHQVKIRGFRIELGEIESLLEQHPAVRDLIVLAREDVPGEQRLVAYVVPEQGHDVTVSELRSFLKEKLPEYMVPSAFVTLQALPLTSNGKVDRRALPLPEGQQQPQLGTAYVAPRNEFERQLTAIWQEVLGVERVGVQDNFFDLGGHSLSMVKVHSRVQELVGREFSVVEMFRAPTVELLAKLLGQAEKQKPSTEQVRANASKQREAMNRQMQMRRDRRK